MGKKIAGKFLYRVIASRFGPPGLFCAGKSWSVLASKTSTPLAASDPHMGIIA
jgi:hypothetical protein